MRQAFTSHEEAQQNIDNHNAECCQGKEALGGQVILCKGGAQVSLGFLELLGAVDETQLWRSPNTHTEK